MQEHHIELRKIKDVNLQGGIVVDGFPSIGLANAIASECLVHSIKTEFVAAMDSPSFPALSVIRNSAPHFPARVYANEELKIGIFVSELNLDPSLYRPVADTMLKWAADAGCKLVISAAGIPYDNPEDNTKGEQKVFAVGSTKEALKRAADAGISSLDNGSIAGIPAILLNEGKWRNIDVIVLLVRVLKDAPDFRAGAAVAEALGKLAPGASCDIPSLLKEAEGMERTLKKIRSEQAAEAIKQQEMYG
ncbi:MAG TPA: PAC2 family protein [Nitrososphaera sp.]